MPCRKARNGPACNVEAVTVTILDPKSAVVVIDLLDKSA
jgi:hypothetical protein